MGFEGKVRGRRKAPPIKSILDRRELEQALDDAGISVKKIHIDTLYQALHRQHYPDLPQFLENYYKNEIGEELGELRPVKNNVSRRKNPNLISLPKALLEFVRDTKEFATLTTKIKDRLNSSDNSTSKLIVELWDGQVVESVLMRYDRKGNGRASLCVSSQCGCAMGCTFCATGTMGLSGNLTTGEILEQMIHADKILGEEFEERYGKENKKKLQFVSNVVFMGMGEPLDNYNNVVAACRAMMDRKRWNLGYGRITVSTVGLVSQIRKLTKELPEVGLALSLHAPNQDARTAIVPTAVRYPIEDLIDALDGHMMAYLKKRTDNDFTQEERIKESSRRRAMIEYVMLEGETSSLECAHQLGKLVEGKNLIVNLIPYNATDVKDKLRCPSEEQMTKFKEIVTSYGSFCTIRRTMGADIASACGQLANTTTKRNPEENPQTPVDIEDVMLAPKPSSSNQASAETNENSQTGRQEEAKLKEATWLESLSNEDLEKLQVNLTIGSAFAASCLLIAGALSFRRR